MAGALNSVLESEEAEGKKQSEHPLYFSQLIESLQKRVLSPYMNLFALQQGCMVPDNKLMVEFQWPSSPLFRSREET